MKASSFNLFFTYDDGTILGYNSRSRSLIELEQHEYEAFQQLSENKVPQSIDSEEQSRLTEEFRRGGFLVEDEINELVQAKAAYETSRFLSRSIGTTIVVTHKCNLACTYCYEERQPYSLTQKDIPKVYNFIDKMIDERRANSFRVTWYGGEPLLKPSFIAGLSKRILKRCERGDVKYRAGIVTNGTLLTRKNAQMLKDSHISYAQVTLDGPKEIHDHRRMYSNGKGSFDAIIENIKQAHDLVKINIRVNVDHQNSRSASELLEILESNDLKNKVTVHFAPVLPYTENCASIARECFTKEDFSEIEIPLLAESLERGFYVDKSTVLPRARTVSCGAVSIGAFGIDAKGHIHKCWNCVGDERETLGSILTKDKERESDSDDVILSTSLFGKDNISKWLAFDPFEIDKCRNCAMLPSCVGGCPYPKAINDEEPRCPTWKYNIKERLWLYRKALMAEQADG